jgi:two-component system, NarL family, response regulator NreC
VSPRRGSFLAICPDAEAKSKPTTIVLAEDHTIAQSSVRMLLNAEPGFEVVAEAGEVEEALRKVQAHKPSVIVLDLSLPGGPSLTVIPRMQAASPETAVVVLTLEDEPRIASEALRAGALGFVLKDGADSELVEAVRAATRGERYLNPQPGPEIASQPDD